MAVKIDLEKAYDKLEWSFIRGILRRYNLPDNLIELIMSCISTISTSLLFNGGSLDSFKGHQIAHGLQLNLETRRPTGLMGSPACCY